MSIKRGDPKSKAKKPSSKAVRLGQVFTSPQIADRMVELLGLSSDVKNALVLDPCVGPGTFPNALVRNGKTNVQIEAFDIDSGMVSQTQALMASHSNTSAYTLDYLTKPSEPRYDYAILNPPYVRQEWIEKKEKYRKLAQTQWNADIPGASNLYVYFIVKMLSDLRVGGRFSCIVYDSWQSTLYGRWLIECLNGNCNSWGSESVNDCPFEGRLIDATILYGEKGRGGLNKSREPENPRDLTGLAKISNCFSTRRGLRLKQADFFMTSSDKIEEEGATPFVKKISKAEKFSVTRDHPEAALLVTKAEANGKTFPILLKRLETAKANPKDNVSVLTWASERPDEWYAHLPPPRAPILFNYYIRHRPRHIANIYLRAYADNFYGLTPITEQSTHAWLAAMNSTLSATGILENARNQGSGLAKVQLFEYRDAYILDIRGWDKRDVEKMRVLGEQLVTGVESPELLLSSVDELVFAVLGREDFRPASIAARYEEVSNRAKRPRETLR